MMKKTVCALAAALALAAAPASAATLSLSPTTPIVANSTFDVDLVVTDLFDGLETDEFLGWGFELAIAGANVSYVSTSTDAAFFEPAEDPFFPEVFSFVSFSNFPLGSLNVGDVTSPFRLATFRFNALAPGAATIDVLTTASLNTGLLFLNAGTVAGSATLALNVEPSAASVPEPASLLLVGGGLAGAVSRYRRRRVS